MTQINLADAPPGTELEVLEIKAGMNARKRLISMGIHAGDKLVKFNGSAFCPVLIKNVTLNSAKIAIGNRLATKIMVGYDEA
jgi:Fe2+ transport system protein FeoA